MEGGLVVRAFLFITGTKEPCQEHRWRRREGALGWHVNCNTHLHTAYIHTLKTNIKNM